MHQDTPGPNEPIDMVIITEHVEDAKMRAAMDDIDGFEDCLAPSLRIRMLDPEPVD